MILLYNTQTGAVTGVTYEPAVKVSAWLSGNPDIAAETSYLEYDETIDPVEAVDIINTAVDGKYYVAGDEIYEDATYGGQ